MVSPRSVLPPYKDEWTTKFESIKSAIPKHCFEHSYLTSFRYLFVDLAVSAALFYAVSVLEQQSLHPALSAFLYSPLSLAPHTQFSQISSVTAHSRLASDMPRIGCARAASSPEYGSSLTSADTVDSAPVIWSTTLSGRFATLSFSCRIGRGSSRMPRCARRLSCYTHQSHCS